MRFPYQRSVGRDLQELFKYERLRAGAEPLGQSSIDEGSGSLEVRDGAGGAVAAIGDLPGGRLGIGIVWDGDLTDLALILQQMAEDIANAGGEGGGNDDVWDARQDSDIAGLNRRAGANENTDTLQGQGLDRLGDQAAATDRTLRGLQERVRALEKGLSEAVAGLAHVGRDGEQTRRGLEQTNVVLGGSIAKVGEQTQRGDVLEVLYEEARRKHEEDRGILQGVTGWLGDFLGDDGPFQSIADTTWRGEAEVKDARAGRSTLRARVDGVASTASGAASAAAAAQSTADEAVSAAAAAQGTANTARTEAAAAQGSADQANDRITDARGSYGSLTSRLNAMDSATSAAASAGAGAASAAAAAQATATNALGKANDAQSDVDQLASETTSAFNTIFTAFNQLKVRVAALDGGSSSPITP